MHKNNVGINRLKSDEFMQEDHQPINRIFFAGAEIMSPKKWFRTILRLKKRKEDKSEQAKVISFFVYTI